jgi:hypothetical protein
LPIIALVLTAFYTKSTYHDGSYSAAARTTITRTA